MVELKLYLTPRAPFQLLRTEFRAADGRVFRAVRGRSGYGEWQGSFQWTRSVHALTLFLVTVAWGRDRLLTGERHSPACSLDFALAKPPLWLLEMFGTNSGGESLLRQMVRRSNSELKSPGPVTLSLGPEAQRRLVLTVHLGDTPCDERALVDVENFLTHVWSKGTLSPERSPQSWFDVEREGLHRAFAGEASQMLRSTDIFCRGGIARLERQLRADPSLRGIRHDLTPFAPIFTARSVRDRLGVANISALNDGPPLQVALPPALAGGEIIFRYLRDIKRCNLIIDSGYPHAVDLYKRMAAGSFRRLPDVCVYGLPPAAMTINLGKRCEYLPQMILPSISHRVVAKRVRSRPRIDRGEFLIVDDPPSTAAFYFESLTRRGAVKRRLAKVVPSENDETFMALRSGAESLRGVLFFPYYSLNVLYNGCHLADDPKPGTNTQPAFLFVHRSVPSVRREALEAAVRNAWLELRSDPSLVRQVVGSMLRDSQYLSLLHRFSGLCHLDGEGEQREAG